MIRVRPKGRGERFGDGSEGQRLGHVQVRILVGALLGQDKVAVLAFARQCRSVVLRERI